MRGAVLIQDVGCCGVLVGDAGCAVWFLYPDTGRQVEPGFERVVRGSLWSAGDVEDWVTFGCCLLQEFDYRRYWRGVLIANSVELLPVYLAGEELLLVVAVVYECAVYIADYGFHVVIFFPALALGGTYTRSLIPRGGGSVVPRLPVWL